MTSECPAPVHLPALRELVRQHRVYFELEPVTATAAGVRVRVGIDLKLWGAHPRSSAPAPGCPRCLAIHHDLQAVASSVLPGDGDTRAEILPFDGLLYLSDRWGRDEIDLTIRILASHRGPAGPAQEQVIRGMRAQLEALGVYEGGWRPSDPR